MSVAVNMRDEQLNKYASFTTHIIKSSHTYSFDHFILQQKRQDFVQKNIFTKHKQNRSVQIIKFSFNEECCIFSVILCLFKGL